MPAAAPTLTPQVTITAIGWRSTADLALQDWMDQGRRIGALGRSAGWWVGDWLRYGNERFGERYTRASKATGYDVQTLMNMVYVASRFDFSRRRENLSWSHHAEVAAMSWSDQDIWLERAERERMSVRDLRCELRNAQRVERAQIEADDEAFDSGRDEAAVRCPQCGYAIHAT